ncbi:MULTISPECIES: ArsR/SmtB family transcription factor [Pseudomonas]|uniref:Putative ArsR-family transcriptional regulator n=1 Tax=Pseudomonas fluorescens (strain Pf0-1) TaxID=205922 RepID=Q3KAJ5_PSEPF|nr:MULTISPECIES: metalloregulator ArsR/SmtB family transcription factor [Pseudomonas]ABA75209.1 putative ArsR-family transcriptional regulator [Pseudomonas fluorescens Pf0-1]MBL0798700.1 helix-turn-helix transcriptional regulator [Pseudomonas sp. B7]MBX8620790.1 metalloregulator ArsR/SmtB family transcription factor [Pseudomonas glycinae]MBY9024572.1 metalloregulator ArsR/SmtB family transcription factor [Pseudomonas fluorescens]MBY9030913.1 metalloregulator ArsR/SmtB family transcription fact
MHAEHQDIGVSQVAAAIAEPARTKMLCSLMDGHARTATELATLAEVSASTASAHLAKLKDLALVRLHVQGRHRYYSLADKRVAQALEALMVIGQNSAPTFKPHTPDRLQFARTCYDHMAGTLAVLLHDRLLETGWLVETDEQVYRLSESGEAFFEGLGIEVKDLSTLRRRFACPCLDWSMRRPHLGGSLGAALLQAALKRKWVTQDLDSRALTLTVQGRRELSSRWGLVLPEAGRDSSGRQLADSTPGSVHAR